MIDREDFKSFIPAEKIIPELTAKAIIIGIFLAIILGAANAYLGLYAGMTVSAIIPGAVMALALLRPFKGTILEVNLATMGASAGECIAAGVIFTIPALILLGVWTEINYLETTLIALLGGLLGVLWMVPLRRALVVKTDLPFPEGVAVAAVLTTTVGGETTEKKTTGVSGVWLGVGALVAGLFKFCELSLNIFRGTIEYISSIGKYKIGDNVNNGWLYGGITISPALLGVGWIIGTRIASYVFVGGLLGWVIIAPIVALANGLPTPAPEFAELGFELGGFYSIWANQVRFIGVGTMLVGGLWAIWAIRMNLAGSIKEAVIGIKGGQVKAKKRTDKDVSFKLIFIFIVLMTIPVFLLYLWLSDMFGISLIMAIITIFFAFIASALAGYLTGLVGSSNMPISGVTVAVLLIVSLIMLGFGVTGAGGMAIVIFISAVIAVGGSISG
ncbi:MAG: oligopeptide transporter, OPT family, partial [Thermoplasmatales archaeon]